MAAFQPLLAMRNRFSQSRWRETIIPDSVTTRAVIFAPHGRDAAVARMLLEGAGVQSVICENIGEFESRLDENACFALVTEEALRFADLRGVGVRVAAQPTWSDLPFIILTHRTTASERSSGATALHEISGNVTLLERPFRPATFVSVIRTIFKGRQRQFEARDHIEELHESEERLRTALLAGHLGAWELNLKTRALTASSVCRAVFGRALDEPFPIQDVWRRICRHDRRRMWRALRVTLAENSDLAVECGHCWPDGSLHWAEIRARLVWDRCGGHPCLVGVCSDVTDRRMGQEALARLNEALEQRVTARTAELKEAHAAVLVEISEKERAQEQLRQAQKMEMIGQLTGGVAHDFNNLLMAVMGNLDVLRKHLPDDPRLTRLINGALQGAQRGAALTQRLLAFARRQDLKAEPRNLADIVRGATDLIERSAGSHIELRLDLPSAIPPTLVDANQMELAVLNLVINARDAMPDGGRLSIAIDQVDRPATDETRGGRFVRLIVSDTGHGMDAQTLQRATEPFFSTKELGKGTGLGLSMVQGLALQLNGAFRLTSQVGRGTQAELLLPVTRAIVREEKPLQNETKEKSGKMTILVVDDDALIAMSTVCMLEDLGHDVIEANSGARALEILRNDPSVDLMVTDYSMPKMNGGELAVAAREIRPHLPILLATGYADIPPGSPVSLPRISKPYRQDQLEAEIAKALRQPLGRKAS
ncbi:hybrid sensor histidine kinase/response regulator [Rhodoblastus acidophilus]|nr:PAS domain-containing sensor histidine kinase [Rhodoblastus acidophilus]